MVELTSITASKLYRISKRKDVLLSRIEASGLNIELKVQKPEEVDESSLPDIPVEEIEVEEEEVPTVGDETDFGESSIQEREVDKTVEERRPFRSAPSHSSSPKPSNNVPEVPEPVETAPSESKQPEPVEEATAVNSSLERTYVQDNMYLEVQDIKGILNALEDTKGVQRVGIKNENELWIYYNDSINLNNVMGPVIEELNKPGYTYLEFNRLARSDNAIVFIIMLEDTDCKKGSIKEIEEEIKEAE